MVNPLLVAYVSGHGFGHATRTGQVLRAVREQAPAKPIAVVSEAPESLFRAAIPGPFLCRRIRCDVGVIQRDALVIDEAATADRCRAFLATWAERVETEATWLSEVGARLVLGDIPPLAFAAARAAGLRGVGLANFSWDWIYRHLAVRAPGLAEVAEHAAACYAQADLLLRLPFAGDLSAFPRTEDLPLVARRPRLDPALSRSRLGLRDDRPAVLVSFGGLGLQGLSHRALGTLAEYDFLVAEGGPNRPRNVQTVDGSRLTALDLGYEDVVAAADVVVTKPGYGIVTDAIAGRTRMIYTDRGDFPEYPILVAEMPRYLPCAYVSNEDLRAARLAAPIRAVLGRPFPEAPRMDGAAVAASRLLSL